MSYPSTATIKRLSMLSRNMCAFPECPISLVDESGKVTGQICHIKAKNSGGPRYDKNQTNEERDAFENLILMCPLHHVVIDSDVKSYTAERLYEIKRDHESKVGTSTRQDILEKLLEALLSLNNEKEQPHSDASKIIKEENSALMRAQKLAKEEKHNIRKQKWLYSYDGLVDGINSVVEIFTLIQNQIIENEETFSTLRIELNASEKNVLVIYNDHFNCVIKLKGYSETYPSNNNLSGISLEMRLLKKTPSHQWGLFYFDPISTFSFKPDLAFDNQVVWVNADKPSQIFSAEGICEKMFALLIDQINKKS